MEEKWKNKRGVVFGLDNILYPEKDYLLQVYYLFSEFINYSEQLEARPILLFMQSEFEANGTTNMFEKTAAKFGIPMKYLDNFKLLHQNARLPLKLLLYQKVLELLQALVVDRKEIFLLVDGDPVQQLNKIKQFEWHGLEGYLKLYFTEEFEAKPSTKAFDFILESNQLQPSDLLLVGNDLADEKYAQSLGVEYLLLSKIL